MRSTPARGGVAGADWDDAGLAASIPPPPSCWWTEDAPPGRLWPLVQPARLARPDHRLPYVWLVLLFLLPFLIVVAMSVATRTPTAPPFGFGGEHP
jgi:hypothetical protein